MHFMSLINYVNQRRYWSCLWILMVIGTPCIPMFIGTPCIPMFIGTPCIPMFIGTPCIIPKGIFRSNELKSIVQGLFIWTYYISEFQKQFFGRKKNIKLLFQSGCVQNKRKLVSLLPWGLCQVFKIKLCELFFVKTWFLPRHLTQKFFSTIIEIQTVSKHFIFWYQACHHLNNN